MDPVVPQSEPSFESHTTRTKPQINLAVVVMVLGFIAVLVIGWIVVQQFLGGEEIVEATPTPVATPLSTIEESPSPVLSETSTTDKKDLKVEILNGTGIAKEASLLQEKLKSLGFESFETGNADSKTYDVAQVAFSDVVGKSVQDEVMKVLNDTYSDVKEVSLKSSSTVDISIITGLRPGVTRPTAAPSSAATAKPSASSSASPSATPQ